MTAEQFAYWLQGFAELNAEPPTPEQWQSINEHLQTVFVKVTPEFVPTLHDAPGYLRRNEIAQRLSDFARQPFNPVITC